MAKKADAENEPIKDEEPTFENKILDVIGHFGLFQRIAFAILTLTDIPSGMSMLYFIFANANPGTRCRLFEGNVTSENNFTINNAIACSYNGSKCVEFEYRDDFTSIVTEWDLVCTSNYIPKLTVSIQFVGVMLGSAVTGQIADLFGRKRICLFVNTMMLLTQSMVGFANSWEVYTAIRFFVGMFAGGSIGINFALPMEFVGPKWRPFAALLSTYSVGHVVMVLTAWGVRDWRNLSYITGTICTPLLLGIAFFVPESPRWLIQRGSFEEAHVIISKMAKWNKTPVPTMADLKQIHRLEAKKKEVDKKYTYLDLFKTKTLAIRTFVTMFIEFSASQLYYGVVVQISSFTGNVYLNALISAVTTLPLQWMTIPITTKLGRKKVFLAYVITAAACMFLIVILSATGHVAKNPHITTGLALFGKSLINAMWGITVTWVSELYPTLMRNLACGAGNAASRIGGFLSPQFAYLGVIIHWTIPYIIHGCLAVGCGILETVFLPETNDNPLCEETPGEGGGGAHEEELQMNVSLRSEEEQKSEL